MAARRTIEKGATKDIWRLLDDAQRAPPPQAALDGESKPTDGACVARPWFQTTRVAGSHLFACCVAPLRPLDIGAHWLAKMFFG